MSQNVSREKRSFLTKYTFIYGRIQQQTYNFVRIKYIFNIALELLFYHIVEINGMEWEDD